MTGVETFGSGEDIAAQRHIYDLLPEVRAVAGLVPQGRQVMVFGHAATPDLARLITRFPRLSVVGPVAVVRTLEEEVAATKRRVIRGRLVMKSLPTVFERCAQVVAEREATGPVPELQVLDAGSAPKDIQTIQRGLQGVHLMPLPGYFLRGLDHTQALTLAARDTDGTIIGSSTVQSLAAAGSRFAQTLFSCALWVHPANTWGGLGRWLYAASVLAARERYQARELWSTVSENNDQVIRLLRRCDILPDAQWDYRGFFSSERHHQIDGRQVALDEVAG